MKKRGNMKKIKIDEMVFSPYEVYLRNPETLKLEKMKKKYCQFQVDSAFNFLKLSDDTAYPLMLYYSVN